MRIDNVCGNRSTNQRDHALLLNVPEIPGPGPATNGRGLLSRARDMPVSPSKHLKTISFCRLYPLAEGGKRGLF